MILTGQRLQRVHPVHEEFFKGGGVRASPVDPFVVASADEVPRPVPQQAAMPDVAEPMMDC